jgi:hypothetical protein
MKIVGAGGPCEAIATKHTNARRRSETWVQYSTASISRKRSEKHVLFLPMGSPHLTGNVPVLRFILHDF